MFDIIGKVALVSGGASGIGLETVNQLLQNGSKGVTIADNNEENGSVVVEQLNEKYGKGKVLFVKVNVANRTEYEEAFKKTISIFQNLDIVINSAGVLRDFFWEEEIAINLGGTVTGTFFAIEKYLPKYRSGSEGVIVNISSISALQVYTSIPVYSATKSGVAMLTQCFGSSEHYNRNQVRVMAICPSYTNTPLLSLNAHVLISPTYVDIQKRETAGAFIQSCEHVGKTIIKMIKEGPNGSIWVVENNEPARQVQLSVTDIREQDQMQRSAHM